MRRIAALVAVGGLAAFTVAGLALRDRFVVAEADDPPVAAPSENPPPAAAVPTRVPPVRPVAPDVVSAPPVGRDTLERAEPRKPLGEVGAARSPSEGPPAETLLFRPVATAGGAFTALGYEVRLAGIVPTDASESCTVDGVSWPCGIHARTAFRNWLRGRALTCVVPPAPPAEPVVSKCLLGRQDAAAWLVTQGWARAEAGGDYAGFEDEARAARRGLFGSAPAVPAEAGPAPVGAAPSLPDSSGPSGG